MSNEEGRGMGTFMEKVWAVEHAGFTPMVERMGQAQQDRLTLAHALVGQAMVETGRRSSSFAASNAALRCVEIRNRLEECGAEPDQDLGAGIEGLTAIELSPARAASSSPGGLLDRALTVLEEIPAAEVPVGLDGVWGMIAGTIAVLDDAETADRGNHS